MQIRGNQMTSFNADAEQRFRNKLASFLRANHAGAIEDVETPDDLDRLIRAGVARARTHGMTTQLAIAPFVALMFEIGPNFDEFPPIREILSDSSIPPDKRVEALDQRITEQQWREAWDSCHETEWPDPAE